MYCRVKAIARNDSVMNIGCCLAKPLRALTVRIKFFIKRHHFDTSNTINQVGTSWHHRPIVGHSTYNTIINVQNLEGCKLVKTAVNSILAPLLQFMNTTFKGLIRECPYPPGFIRFDNVTFNPHTNPGISMLRERFRLPSGNYKIVIDIKTPSDQNVAHIEIFYVIHFRNQTLLMDDRF